MSDGAGPLIAIGGHEDKEGDRVILRTIADGLKGGKLVIATIASHEPEGYFENYRKAFEPLGVTDLVELYVDDRGQAIAGHGTDELRDAAGIFFSGGDQLRIVSQIGDTPLETLVREIHDRGGLIAGTSAGALVQSDTMLVGGSSAEARCIGGPPQGPG